MTITVATFESGWRQMDRLGNRFELVIIDEAHHFGSGVRDKVLELCAAPARLGLTATPPSGPAADRLAELVGPTVFELSLGDLTGRYLAPFQLVTLKLDLDPRERAAWVHAVAVYRPATISTNHRRDGSNRGWTANPIKPAGSTPRARAQRSMTTSRASPEERPAVVKSAALASRGGTADFTCERARRRRR